MRLIFSTKDEMITLQNDMDVLVKDSKVAGESAEQSNFEVK